MNAEIISTGHSAALDTGPADDEFATELRTVCVPVELHGTRLDKALALLMPEFSRSYLQQRLAQGDITAAGVTVTKAATRVNAGQVLAVTLRPSPQAQSFKPEHVPLKVVFEDEHLLVIDKSAGLVVHPAAGNWSGTLLNGLLMHHPGAAELPRAGIVHRLDKDTSGLMVVGKTRQAVDALTRQIAARSVQRYYLALAERAWKSDDGVIRVEQPIGRDPHNRLRMAVLGAGHPGGKAALTWLVRLAVGPTLTLCGCKLFTGRTHQIRVHLSWLGHPIAGDLTYGGHPLVHCVRQALHATRLELCHPVTQQAMVFFAPLPQDMAQACSVEGLHYNAEQLGPSAFGL